jgi:Ca2+-binding RTX toxin-like protein
MSLHIDTATITTDTNDTGSSGTDWLTSDNQLVFGGDITAVHGSGTTSLGIWISGGSFGADNGGKGTLLGSSTTFTGTGAWSFDASSLPALSDGTYTIHITEGTGTGASDLASHSLIVDTTAPTVAADSDGAGNNVDENAANGTAVGVTASSSDANGVTYSITADSSDGGFAVDASTGVVTVADGTKLDYEAATSHSITVTATDDAGNTSTDDFTIAVNDVNDNAPVFSSGTTANEDENSDVSNVVYTAAASDVDTVGTVSYSLSGDDAALFAIDSGTGEVTFVTSPDHEAPADANSDNAYQVTVHANDGVNDTTQDVTISVNDLNDNAPSFTSETSASEDENSDPSTVVYTAAASDPDTVGSVAYSLAGDDAALFSIDSSTGEVTFNASPDFEKPTDLDHNNAYQVTVHANDGVNDTAQDVTISVDNVAGLTVSGGSGLIIGTNEEDNLTGDSGVNTIIGLAGADVMDGGGDDDFLSGRLGDDSLAGGTGNDILRGNAGADILNGGDGADAMMGGIGRDTFVFGAASDSTSTGYDSIGDMNFTRDVIDLSFTVTGVDAGLHKGFLSAASFDADMAAGVDAPHLGANHAMTFTASSGDLAGEHFLVIDANGVAGYQAGADLVIHVQASANFGQMDVTDFV